jgi:hypothetical protein
MAETSLDTEAAVIGTGPLNAGDPDDLVVVEMKIKLTTHTAIPARGSDLVFVRGQVILLQIIGRDQGADRAGLKAFSAENTIRIP